MVYGIWDVLEKSNRKVFCFFQSKCFFCFTFHSFKILRPLFQYFFLNILISLAKGIFFKLKIYIFSFVCFNFFCKLFLNNTVHIKSTLIENIQ